MQEVVQSYINNGDFFSCGNIQRRIIYTYEQDFSKHAQNKIIPKIRLIWNYVSSQLVKENKKFIYRLLREGARAKDYETAIM